MMRIKYLAKSALLALLTLAFILPAVACGGGDGTDGGGSGAKLYSLKDAAWVGFKKTEDITAALDYEGLQEAWDGYIWYNAIAVKQGRSLDRGLKETFLGIWVFEGAISESLKAEIQSAGVAEGLSTLFYGRNLVVRCPSVVLSGRTELDIGDAACAYFIERMKLEE